MTFTNMYNLNMMNGNGWGGLLQSGLNMFGGNSYGNFGMMGMGGSIWGGNMFTNCLGEVDYDKMAGFGVANALCGVTAQAFQSIRANRQEQKQDVQNASDRINEIDNEIANLKKTNVEGQIDSHFATDIENAISNANTAQLNLNKANEKLIAAQGLDDSVTTKAEQIEAARGEVNKFETELKKYNNPDKNVEGSIEYFKAKEKEAIEAKKQEIQEKIEKLQTEKAELQEKVEQNTLEHADKRKINRVSKEKYESCFGEDGKLKSDAEVSPRVIRYAICGLKKAQTKEEQTKWANQIKDIYLELDENDKSKDIMAAYNIACKYAD